MTHNGCVWQVWLNVLAGPVEWQGDQQWPRLLQDKDGCWQAEGLGFTPRWAQDY